MFDASTMVYFRKHLDEVTLMTINEKTLDAYLKEQTKETEASKSKDDDDSDSNCGSFVLDTHVLHNRSSIHPTDTEFTICEENQWKKPPTYHRFTTRSFIYPLSVVRRKHVNGSILQKISCF